jgi:hypothetical protein
VTVREPSATELKPPSAAASAPSPAAVHSGSALASEGSGRRQRATRKPPTDTGPHVPTPSPSTNGSAFTFTPFNAGGRQPTSTPTAASAFATTPTAASAAPPSYVHMSFTQRKAQRNALIARVREVSAAIEQETQTLAGAERELNEWKRKTEAERALQSELDKTLRQAQALHEAERKRRVMELEIFSQRETVSVQRFTQRMAEVHAQRTAQQHTRHTEWQREADAWEQERKELESQRAQRKAQHSQALSAAKLEVNRRVAQRAREYDAQRYGWTQECERKLQAQLQHIEAEHHTHRNWLWHMHHKTVEALQHQHAKVSSFFPTPPPPHLSLLTMSLIPISRASGV